MPNPVCLRTVGNNSGPCIEITFQELLTPNFPSNASDIFSHSLDVRVIAIQEKPVISIKRPQSLRRPIYRRNSTVSNCEGSSTSPDNRNVI